MKAKPLIKCYCLFLILSISSLVKAATYQTTPTVWDVLRKQFMLDHEVNRPEVQEQLQWLLRNPEYLKHLARSEPYMYHILTEIQKRDLPGEIALVPMLESAFDPFAYSGVGAAGLWQIMPQTGADFGLKRDWWIEPRRSITSSTTAALRYYTRLNKFFEGNWLLIFAAYDSGEGNVARAAKDIGKTRSKANFWALRLPQETKIYVPRLLALAEIIQHPNRYNITLPYVLHQPYFEEVELGKQIDLNHAAKLAGMSYQDLIRLNPGYNRWATAPDTPQTLLLPIHRTKGFMQSLSKFSNTENTETKKSMTATPEPNIPENSTYKVIHIVQKTDSFQSLQQKYDVSEAAIRTWNHLDKEEHIQPGQELLIWKRRSARTYVVKRGDSLSHIASRNKVSIQRILALNPGLNQNLIKPGQTILLS